jgi:ubiquinone/menaquinone biosynthesis C-methylase UbiE
MDLRDLVGETGEVTALDPSNFYLDWLRKQAGDKVWTNVKCVQGTAESTALPSQSYDLIFVRWVIAFVPDPETFLLPLFNAL